MAPGPGERSEWMGKTPLAVHQHLLFSPMGEQQDGVPQPPSQRAMAMCASSGQWKMRQGTWATCRLILRASPVCSLISFLLH